MAKYVYRKSSSQQDFFFFFRFLNINLLNIQNYVENRKRGNGGCVILVFEPMASGS